ncbi:MAG: helix-hairpin-helix domain-containing protein [Prevotella sp.]|nr:helix-hairpin-helix domain-containing protein [Prevotella sp.]
MKALVVSIGLLLGGVLNAWGQDDSWQDVIAELATSDDMESPAWDNTIDLLTELADSPIDINNATREELERLPFLSDIQIEDIMAYLYQYGSMKSEGELAMIVSLDPLRRKLLTRFIFFGEKNEDRKFPKLSDISKYGKHDILASIKVPFYERKGDKNGYLGYQYKHSIRYTFSYSDYVKIGLTGAQDAGEPFFAGRNSMGYDHYSFYLSLRKMGRIKSLVVGRYKVKMGMGLVINNNIGLGKLTSLSSLGRQSNYIGGYSSRSDANYLQGAAITVSLPANMELTAFASYREIDATLNKDDGSIATILKTGYHRTPTEMEKKNNSSQSLAGGNLSFDKNGFHAGVTALYTHLNRNIDPGEQLYRRYYAKGQDYWNISVDYGFNKGRFSFAGETATGDCNAIATINKLGFRASGSLSLMAVYRRYSYKYYSLFSESFSEGGYVQNESGIYLGAEWHPSSYLSMSAYSDYSHFPWAKYLIDFSSRAWDNLVSASYSRGNITLGLRYRLKMKEKNNDEKNGLTDDITHKTRLFVEYKTETWKLKTQADFTSDHYKENSNGWMITQSASWTPNRKLSFSASAGYFNTDDYNSRICFYEKGLLYSFNYPSLYGEGVRYSLWTRLTLSSRIWITAKLATTDYFDRDHISSGLQQIDHSSMTDLELQMRVRI